MFGSFAAVLFAFPGIALVTASPMRWWLLLLVPFGLLVAYSAVRLLTLRVVLDETGLLEPAPFRPTVRTPWEDLVRVRRTEDPRALGLTFLGVGIEHKGGWKHQVLALNINNRDPLAEATIDDWMEQIREAKRRFLRP